MDVEPDHDVEPALSLFSHVRPLRQDSHNTEGEGDQKLSGEDIIKSICIVATLNKIKTHMEGYTFMLFLKALHDFKMLNDSSLIGGARLH